MELIVMITRQYALRNYSTYPLDFICKQYYEEYTHGYKKIIHDYE